MKNIFFQILSIFENLVILTVIIITKIGIFKFLTIFNMDFKNKIFIWFQIWRMGITWK